MSEREWLEEFKSSLSIQKVDSKVHFSFDESSGRTICGMPIEINIKVKKLAKLRKDITCKRCIKRTNGMGIE